MCYAKVGDRVRLEREQAFMVRGQRLHEGTVLTTFEQWDGEIAQFVQWDDLTLGHDHGGPSIPRSSWFVDPEYLINISSELKNLPENIPDNAL